MIHRQIERRHFLLRGALARIAAAACACVIALAAGCGGNADAIEKAQIAVRANPSLELVATDERQGVLTVRVRQSGQVITVSASDVISGIAFRDLNGGQAAGGGSSSQRVAVSTPGGQVAVSRSGGGVDVSTSEGNVSVRRSGSGVGVPTPEGDVGVRQSGSGLDVSTSAGGNVSVRGSGGGLAVSTPDGQVNVGGAGISAQADARAREAAPARSPRGPDRGAGGAVLDDSRLERQSRPVACKGDNSIDLSDVLLRVSDVAVESIGSCVVHIRNSHIIADVGVQATGGTNVTIENSIIEGRVALALKGSATVSVQSSTIRGAVQRVGSTNLRDLGGNLWR